MSNLSATNAPISVCFDRSADLPLATGLPSARPAERQLRVDRARSWCTRFKDELRPTAPESGCRHRYRSDHSKCRRGARTPLRLQRARWLCRWRAFSKRVPGKDICRNCGRAQPYLRTGPKRPRDANIRLADRLDSGRSFRCSLLQLHRSNSALSNVDCSIFIGRAETKTRGVRNDICCRKHCRRPTCDLVVQHRGDDPDRQRSPGSDKRQTRLFGAQRHRPRSRSKQSRLTIFR